MAKVENKCTNCHWMALCKRALSSKVVVWKHCEQFKPSERALQEAQKKRRKERDWL